jgi:predicted nucleotidyltransferase
MAALPIKVRTSVTELIRQLNANDLAICQAFVFGSYAKGQQTEWSDIDVALVSAQFQGNSYYDRRKVSPYKIKIDIDLEVHPFRPEDFTEDNPFVEEIIKTGIRIV